MSVSILHGDARVLLPTLTAATVQCCVTSPPYWGLRDYGVEGQLGLERTPEEYVANLVAVFREVRRVLRDDGTLWLNLGDSYAGSWGNYGGQNRGKPGGQRKIINGSAVPNPAYDGLERFRPPTSSPPGLKPKDLVGIPWRTAFALQQPDYLGKIRSEIDRAWLAALTDGEGCITILETTSPHGSGNSYPPVLQVRMCDIECIEKAATITGYGSASPEQEPPSQGGQRGSYQWRLNGRKAADTIAEIYPHLLIKRKQAVVAWNHQAVRDGYHTKRGVKIPDDALQRQQFCRELIRKLNDRAPVDIPSWMIEPPLPVGPGWYLRSDVIWHKPNPMPESVTDRPTKAHEYLFLLAKSERYYYDAAAIAEPAICGDPRKPYAPGQVDARGNGHDRSGGTIRPSVARGGFNGKTEATAAKGRNAFRAVQDWRNKRSVWTIPTKPYPEAHFATFPVALVEPCILAGSRVGDVVLDPFAGAGTTLYVAKKLGRDGVGIELNRNFCWLTEQRCAQEVLAFA